MIDARRPVAVDGEHDAVDAAHPGLVAVDDLLIEDVADQVEALAHQLPPTNASGMETTASTSVSSTMPIVAKFEKKPLACSRSSLRSFISSSIGIATTGSTAALMAMVEIVSFSGSRPNSVKSALRKIAAV